MPGAAPAERVEWQCEIERIRDREIEIERERIKEGKKKRKKEGICGAVYSKVLRPVARKASQ